MKQYFIEFVKKNFFLIVLATLLQVCSNLLSIVIPLSYQNLIDNIISKGQYKLLWTYVMFISTVFLIYFIFDILANKIVIHCVMKLHGTLKEHAVSTILRGRKTQVDKMNKGEIITRVIQDISTLANVIAEYVIVTVMAIFMFVIMIVIIFHYHVILGVICLVSSPIFFVCSNVFGKKIEKKTRQVNIMSEQYLNNLDECIESKDVIRFYDCYEYQFGRYKKVLDSYIRENKTLMNQSLYAKKTFGGLSTIFPLIILIVGAKLILDGSLTVGVLVSILSCINYVLMPSTLMSGFIIAIKQFKVSYQRLSEILQAEEEQQALTDEAQKDSEYSVQLNELSFSYPEHPIFSKINVKIQKDQFISVVGRNGIGKSTLVQLLIGNYEPAEGEIYLFDTKVSKENAEKYVKLLSPIKQHEFLFDDTIARNITFLNEAPIDLEKFHGLLNEEQLNKRVGKNGCNLSGGEKQKVCIARGIEKESKILILDEGNANFDLTNQAVIHTILEKEKGKRTIIVIDHNMSFIDISDQILFFQDENHVLLNTHDTLYTNNEEYRELYLMSRKK